MDRLDMIQTMYDKKGPVIAKNFESVVSRPPTVLRRKKRCKKLFPIFPAITSSLGEVRLQSMISDCAHMCWNIIPASTGTQQRHQKNALNSCVRPCFVIHLSWVLMPLSKMESSSISMETAIASQHWPMAPNRLLSSLA